MLEEQISVIKKSIESVSAHMTRANKAKRIAELSKQLRDLNTSAVTVLVCGEFKRGKSMFINALIGRDVCPTDVDICTSVVSVIKYGEKEKATRIYGDLSNLKQEVVLLTTSSITPRGRPRKSAIPFAWSWNCRLMS